MARRKEDERKQFIAELIKNGGNGAQAAQKIGIKPTSAAQIARRYLSEPGVQAELARARAKVENKLDITIEKKMKVLWDIANPEGYEEVNQRDRISAIQVLNAMQGHNAPTKQETDLKSNGEAITAVVILPSNQIGKL